MDEFYKPTPDGLIGNEDCGQMSAWYILSASGFYPVAPGNPVYDFGTPLFPEIKYNLENGKSFVIKAPNVSASNIFIKSVKLNGKPHNKSYISHQDVMNGGILEFEMSDVPVKTAFPDSKGSAMSENTPAVPLIEGAGRVFQRRKYNNFENDDARCENSYSIDGGERKRNIQSL